MVSLELNNWLWFFRLNIQFIVFIYSLFFIFYSFFLYFVFFYFFDFNSFLFEFYFLTFGGLDFSVTLIFDFLSIGFFSCVSFISGVLFFYRLFYMEGTIDFRRFLYLVFLFVFSIFFLVFSGRFFLTMVGWDGLGLISFLLVIFYPNSYSLISGLITVFSNRVGDVFFIFSFFFIYISGTFFFDFSSLNLFVFFSIFVFLGSITKRAQFPFSAWLPAAMAAPTPVSSLVHSSTLVTAGVYVLIRFNYVFTFLNFYFLKLFFLLTMVFAGFSSMIEKDLKKVVAISTLSQLGMIMFILSCGVWVLTFIHVIIHAFFKSIIFLRVGSLMGQIIGIQDSRFYGAFFFSYTSYLYFLVSCFCLSGFPFFIGFYSKDFIISSVSSFEGFLLYYFFLVGCFCTVGYRLRLLYEAYQCHFKNTSFFVFKESFYFLIPVRFLFFKCWFLGGLFYWYFLFDMVFFFSFLDLLIGVVLLIFGFLFFYFFNGFLSFYSLFDIIFLRWLFMGGVSNLFKFLNFYKHEVTWMEIFGGGNLYSILYYLNFKSFFFELIGLGVLIFLSFLIFFYFVI